MSKFKRIFSDVDDITQVLEIIVLDENKRTKSDFLGKVSIFCVHAFCQTENSFRFQFHS